jgi:hypothetical protein
MRERSRFFGVFSKIFLPKTPLGYKVYLLERVKHVPGTSHESVGLVNASTPGKLANQVTDSSSELTTYPNRSGRRIVTK